MSVARLGQVQPKRTLVRVRGPNYSSTRCLRSPIATTRSPSPRAARRRACARSRRPANGRVPSARALALYALGLVAGFLLAGLASLPGGAEVVSGQLGLAVAAAVVAGLAALRARAVARRRPARP